MLKINIQMHELYLVAWAVGINITVKHKLSTPPCRFWHEYLMREHVIGAVIWTKTRPYFMLITYCWNAFRTRYFYLHFMFFPDTMMAHVRETLADMDAFIIHKLYNGGWWSGTNSTITSVSTLFSLNISPSAPNGLPWYRIDWNNE